MLPEKVNDKILQTRLLDWINLCNFADHFKQKIP